VTFADFAFIIVLIPFGFLPVLAIIVLAWALVAAAIGWASVGLRRTRERSFS